MTATDDTRAGAQIRANLSTQVFTAALAGIAAEVVLTTFVFQFRRLTGWFDFVAILAALAFGGSIFFGMRFVAKLSTGVYEGASSKEEAVGEYYSQATLGSLGFVLVVVCATLAGCAPERNGTVLIPTSFVWFNHTWGRDDRTAFERQAFSHGQTRTHLTELYCTHTTVRRVLGIADCKRRRASTVLPLPLREGLPTA